MSWCCGLIAPHLPKVLLQVGHVEYELLGSGGQARLGFAALIRLQLFLDIIYPDLRTDLCISCNCPLSVSDLILLLPVPHAQGHGGLHLHQPVLDILKTNGATFYLSSQIKESFQNL